MHRFYNVYIFYNYLFPIDLIKFYLNAENTSVCYNQFLLFHQSLMCVCISLLIVFYITHTSLHTMGDILSVTCQSVSCILLFFEQL